MTRRPAALLLSCLALGVTPAAGQRASGSLTLGASRLTFAAAEAIDAVSLSPTFSLGDARTLVSGSGAFSRLDGRAWSTQGIVNASHFTRPSPRGSVWEFAATAGGSSLSEGPSTGQALAAARWHRLGESIGGWLGASAGTQSDGATWRGLLQGELGVTLRRRGALFALQLQPTRADTIEYVDARAAIELWRGAFEGSASAGVRRGAAPSPLLADQREWGSLSIRWWFRPQWALEAAAGAYPADLTQGFPSGRFLSFGLRVGGQRHVEALLLSPDPRDRREAERAGVDRAEVVLRGGRSVLRVRAPSAARVEVSGDFTAWRPVAMRRDGDGWWVLETALPTGTHEVTVRVDGGAWVVPPGFSVVTDEFGGRVGRVVVP